MQTWIFYRSLIESLESLPGVKRRGGFERHSVRIGKLYHHAGDHAGKARRRPGGLADRQPGLFPRDGDSAAARARRSTSRTRTSATATTIVSQETAQRMWGGADPLGKVLRFGNGREFVVVGVVGGVRNASLNQDRRRRSTYPRCFAHGASWTWWCGRPAIPRRPWRARGRSCGSSTRRCRCRACARWSSGWTSTAAQPRLNAVLLMVFSGLAMLIAAIGIYGVLSYSVTQRTREIGLRIAIGAQPAGVLRWVVREGMLVALAGIALGLAGALAVSRLLATLLFGVQARATRGRSRP